MRNMVCVLAALSGLVLLQPPLGARKAEPSVHATIERIVSRMRASLSDDAMLAADAATVDRFVTPDDREVLGTRYWSFTTDVPVIVSVMRHVAQETPPFWLVARGFRRTDFRVRNEEYEYEVWQKPFPAGRVGLGINGFDKHRPHYFVCVGSQTAGVKPKLTGFAPAGQRLLSMRTGSTIYHDWPDLTLTVVPEALRGHVLLPTIRGRAREAHLIGGFRRTAYPSSSKPDQTVLTWSDDPRTTQTVQWRASATTGRGLVRWRRVGSTMWRSTVAAASELRDSRIMNDPVVRRFSATIRGLRPGSAYEYQVQSPEGAWSERAAFRTAPSAASSLSFVWLSDTHNSPDTRALLDAAEKVSPSSAFVAISGDLVGTGQYRDDWDKLFEHTGPFARRKPLVPSIGNHDTIDGLGADLYLSLLKLPRNGARGLQPGRSFHFTYGPALFVVLDCTDSIEAQRPWLDQVLRTSKAPWKIAMFHFPPYAPEEDYPEIRREWCPLFDRHGVDFVLSGHVHNLQRSWPIRAGKRVKATGKGVTYLMTVAVGQGRGAQEPSPLLAVNAQPGPPVYHMISMDGRRATVVCRDATGKVWDRVEVRR